MIHDENGGGGHRNRLLLASLWLGDGKRACYGKKLVADLCLVQDMNSVRLDVFQYSLFVFVLLPLL
jgi:hypothetical protein